MEKAKKVTLSGMLFAIGLILPFFIGQIPAVGKMLLPMHIPVLICGLILGWQYGLAVGFLLPLVRSVAGWLYSHAKWQRTKEWYEEPGGNVDYKRFEQKVLVPLKKGETVFYRPYYPPKWSFLETAEIAPCRVNIVEGTYSCHERLEAYYDLKVFLTIDPIEQIQRIEKRNGSEKAVEFQKKWIPLEELYFEKCRTRSRCDVCFTMCDEM